MTGAGLKRWPADHLPDNMDSLFKVSWFGESEKRYAFHVFEKSKKFRKSLEGVYIFARISSKNTWMPIYMGQGSLHEPLWAKPEVVKCIEDKGVTHIHVRPDDNRRRRIQIVKDLMERYVMVFDPVGCNQHRQYRGLAQEWAVNDEGV